MLVIILFLLEVDKLYDLVRIFFLLRW